MSINTQIKDFEDSPIRPVHKKIIAGSMMGLFADGYILGSVGLALALATVELSLSSAWVGLIGASTLLGLMIGSLLIGTIVDRFGRKPVYYLTMPAFFIFSFLQLFISNEVELLFLRFLLGFAIGADYTVAVALVSEWAPKKTRAPLLSSLLVVWAVGYALAYIVGSLFLSPEDGNWRLFLASAALLPIVGFIIRLGAPESPMWYLSKGKKELAQADIDKFLGPEYTIFHEVKEGFKAKWSMLFSVELRKNTIVSATFYACQIVPFFAITIFLPNIMNSINIGDPVISGILFNVFLVLGFLIGMYIIDKIPRRVFLIYSFYVCAIILLLMSVWQNMPSVLALICLTSFSLVISCAMVLQFVYPPELFPTELRGSGVGFTVSASRVGSSIGTFLLPVVLNSWGVSAALAGCVASLLIGGIVCQLYAPETLIKNEKP